MAFRIVFYCEKEEEEEEVNSNQPQVVPKPLFGTVVFDSGTKNQSWRSKSMEEPINAPLSGSAETSVLSKSVEGESNKKEEGNEGEEEEVVFFGGNPEVEVVKGVLRLFKDNKVDGGTKKGLPTKRSDLVCVLAVPSSYSSSDICQFFRAYTKYMLLMRVLRDQSPERLLLVMRMCNQEKADELFLEFNGVRYRDGLVCAIVSETPQVQQRGA